MDNDDDWVVERMDEEMRALVAAAGALGIEIGPVQQRQFDEYANMLLDWNRRINLVRVDSRGELLRAHILDSLWCSAAIDPGGVLRLLDLGSGAGFPGIPLRICFPGPDVWLLESQQRRIGFLAEAVRRLGLERCTVTTGRAEDVARGDDWREAFDCVVTRAVAPLVVLAELALPLLTRGGRLIALKGYAVAEELAAAAYAIKLLGGAEDGVIPYRFAGERGRNVVSIKKISATPERYPRRAGVPGRRPLFREG